MEDTKEGHRHHILPRSMGGLDDPDNLVYLTERQHFIAHLLLSNEWPTQIFACELLSQSCGIPLKKWQRRRISFLRAALQRAKRSSRVNTTNNGESRV